MSRGAIVGAGALPRRLARMAEYVFTLRNVRKAHGDKVVLDNVTLSFLHGAKIGVVGPNGTGKSSLLKIMAQLDHANNGDAILDPEATVGMLQQEPPLSEGRTVLENVEEAVGELKAKMKRLEDAYMELTRDDVEYKSHAFSQEPAAAEQCIDGEWQQAQRSHGQWLPAGRYRRSINAATSRGSI